MELRAAHIIAGPSNHFRENLNAETEDGKYEILSALLAIECQTLRTRPLQ
jgi:hypothetical protein